MSLFLCSDKLKLICLEHPLVVEQRRKSGVEKLLAKLYIVCLFAFGLSKERQFPCKEEVVRDRVVTSASWVSKNLKSDRQG